MQEVAGVWVDKGCRARTAPKAFADSTVVNAAFTAAPHALAAVLTAAKDHLC